jgi:homoserine kinase type II
VIHGDLFGDNLVIGPAGDLSVIDWETASLDDPVLDVGMAAFALCADGGRLDEARIRLLLSGYRPPGRRVDPGSLRAAIEYAGVVIAFHRYRRYHVLAPEAAGRDAHREAMALVDREFPLPARTGPDGLPS